MGSVVAALSAAAGWVVVGNDAPEGDLVTGSRSRQQTSSLSVGHPRDCLHAR